MKNLFRCVECQKYTLNKKRCPYCNGKVVNPYPARFSLEKERKFRYLYKNKN